MDETRAFYQSSLYDFQKAELSAKNAKEMIAFACGTIAKMQALLRDNEQVLEPTQRNIGEFSARANQLHEELMVQSSSLETLKAQHAEEVSLLEEELLRQAQIEAEEVSQQELRTIKYQIKSLARQN